MIAARGLRSAAELAVNKPHGTRLRYLGGCKCFQCRRANSDYERERNKARAAGDWNGIVDAAPALKHMRKLSRAGVGRNAVVAATSIPKSTICGILAGKKRHIRARTLRKILAVNVNCKSDHALVPATRLWQQINALLEEGFTKQQLARHLGYARMIQFRKTRVTVRNAHRVDRLYRRFMT